MSKLGDILRQLLELEVDATPRQLIQALFDTRTDLERIRGALEDPQPLYPLGDPERNFVPRTDANRWDKDAILMQVLNAFARWQRIPEGFPFEHKFGVRVHLRIYKYVIDADGEEKEETVYRSLTEKKDQEQLLETKLPLEIAEYLESYLPGFFKDEDGNWREFVWIPMRAWMNLCTLRGARTALRVSNESAVRSGEATRKILLDDIPKELGFIHSYSVEQIVALLTVCPFGSIYPHRESFFDGITQGRDTWVPVPWAPPQGIKGVKRNRLNGQRPEKSLNLFYDIFAQLLEVAGGTDEEQDAVCWRVEQQYMDFLRTIADTLTEQRLLRAARYNDPDAESFVAAADFNFDAVHGDLTRKDVARAWDDGLWDHLETRLPDGMPDDSARRAKFEPLWKAADQSEFGMVHEEARRGLVTRWSDLEERLGHGWLATEDERVELKNEVARTLVDRLGQTVYAEEIAARHRDAPVDVIQGDPEDVFWKQFLSGSLGEPALNVAVNVVKSAPVRALLTGTQDFLDVSDQRFLGVQLPATFSLVYGLIAAVVAFKITGGIILPIVAYIAGSRLGGVLLRRWLGKRREAWAQGLATVLLILGILVLVALLCGVGPEWTLLDALRDAAGGGGSTTPVPEATPFLH